MRILSVHNNYRLRGGEDESRDAEEQLLRDWGHDVETYEDSNDRIPDFSLLHLAKRSIWSDETYQQIKSRLSQAPDDSPYDIVHVQNFFPMISPSVYYAAKARGVPVVQTLRNYRLLCPNALFFREGGVCEDCLGKAIPYPGMLHSCYRGERGSTTATVAMLTVHRLLQTWDRMIDLYITPTEFARQKYIEGGFPAKRIIVKPNFVSTDPGIGSGEGGYALYVGRLAMEKGIDTLLTAWEQLKFPIPLKIVGTGPLDSLVEGVARRVPQVEWLKRQPLSTVYELMGAAKFVVMPSKWYETFGRVIAEAYATGTPVIAAKIGAIAEIVEHDRTGRQFEAGNVEDLMAQIEWMLKHDRQVAQMRQAARQEYETKYTATVNYQQLMKIYDLASGV